MWSIHNCPIIALNWNVDEDGELIDDGSENDEIKSVISDFVKSGYSPKCQRFTDVRNQSKIEYKKRLSLRSQYGEPPPSVTFEATIQYLNNLQFSIASNVKSHLIRNQESLIYKIGMSEEKCKRQDPYTGTQFIYDYAYCRSGSLPEEKHKNLILHFPNIRQNIWDRKNPNNFNTKSCKWYLIANAFVFSDGIKLLR
jgi:hypothetical protein